MTGNRIYLDYNATTPLDPRVFELMTPYFLDTFGNAASQSHPFGWEAKKAVEAAREQLAAGIGASASELVFTSGATESDNIAILGTVEAYSEKKQKNHIITVLTEHKAVLDPFAHLEKKGFQVTWLKPGKDGLISPEQVREAICDKTLLVSVMHVNNEIGVIQPISEIGAVCREKGVFFHTDATQSVGKIALDVEKDNIDLLSMSAHKIYGPKGVGVLYARKRNPRVKPAPLFYGGGHERGMRSGTLNVPGIVGFAKALELCIAVMGPEAERLSGLRNKLEKALLAELDHTFVNGHPEKRVPGCSNMSFGYVEGEGLMMAMPEVAVSSGSACTSANLSPSHVLRAIEVPDAYIHSSLRFSMGRFTTESEIDTVIERVISGVKKLREMSPLYEMAMEGIDLSTVEWRGH
jgi:cysteine desulfurase